MNKKNGIAKSTAYVMIVLIIVKLIGFIKQAVIAAYFGTSMDMDLYLIASEFITEVGTVFFASLSVSFLAMYVKVKEQEGKEEATLLFSNTVAFFIPVALLLVILICFFANPIARLIASGYGETQQQIVGSYIRFLSLAFIGICISNICTSVLEGEKSFLPGKLIGIIQSTCIIVACVMFADKAGISSILYAILIYFIIQNIFLLSFVFKYVRLRVKNFWKDQRVLELFRLCVPLFLGNAVIQINAIVNKSIASHLGEGSVAALSYSNYLFQAVHSIVIGSLCTVIFSYFSSYVAKNEVEKISEKLQKGIAYILLILIPLSLVFVVNAESIIRIVYARGAFNEQSVALTTCSFVGYTIGIIFIAVRDLLIRAHYAFQDTKTPMLNGALGVLINVILSIILSRYVGVFGIAVADAVAYFIVLLLANHSVKRYIKKFKLFIDFKVPAQFAIASVISALSGWLIKGWLKNEYYIGQAIISSVVIVILFLGTLLLMKNLIITELLRTMRGKRGQNKK